MRLSRTVIAAAVVALMYVGQSLFLTTLYNQFSDVCDVGSREHQIVHLALLITTVTGLWTMSKVFTRIRYVSQIVLPILIGCMSIVSVLINDNILGISFVLVMSGLLIVPFFYTWAVWLSRDFSPTGCWLLLVTVLISLMLTVVIQRIITSFVEDKLAFLFAALLLIIAPIRILLLPAERQRVVPES